MNIEYVIYKPAKDVGFVEFDRNMTERELDSEINDRLPGWIRQSLEWSGPCCRLAMPEQDRPLPDCYPGGGADLRVQWRPGNNEGYVVEVLALNENDVSKTVWNAKCFDLPVAVGLHLVLMNCLSGSGGVMSRFVIKTLQHLQDQV